MKFNDSSHHFRYLHLACSGLWWIVVVPVVYVYWNTSVVGGLGLVNQGVNKTSRLNLLCKQRWVWKKEVPCSWTVLVEEKDNWTCKNTKYVAYFAGL